MGDQSKTSPTPWRWESKRFPSALLDAKGEKVMWIQGWDEDSSPWLAFSSPEVKDAIEDAWKRGAKDTLLAIVADVEIEHPAPWRWGPASYPPSDEFGRPSTLALYDRDGEEIVGTDGDDWSWVSVESERVRALIAAAPEMEELLRTFVNCVAPLPMRNLDLNLGTVYSRASALLAHIDGSK